MSNILGFIVFMAKDIQQKVDYHIFYYCLLECKLIRMSTVWHNLMLHKQFSHYYLFEKLKRYYVKSIKSL